MIFRFDVGFITRTEPLAEEELSVRRLAPQIVGRLMRALSVRVGGFPEDILGEVARELAVRPGSTVLDVGCGTGYSSIALVDDLAGDGHLVGVDLSAGSLAGAVRRMAEQGVTCSFVRGSMAALAFADATFDAAISVAAFHEVGPQNCRRAIAEVARVLRPGGRFALVDWSRPRLGILGMLWAPWLWLSARHTDTYHNSYPGICHEAGLVRVRDVYLTDIMRCQVFHKPEASAIR